MTPGGPRFRQPAPPREHDPFDGVVLVDKPAGPTSHDVVAAIRKHFGFRKVGHGGTLDPQATGLLIILVGRGTKLSSSFLTSDKTYEGTIRLGVTTDSQDAQGNVIAEADPSGVTREQLESTMREFVGDIFQTPPMMSAVKVKGVPLYKRARRGQTVKRDPKLVHVYEFSLAGFEPPEGTFLLRCTKGTYARTLCHDVGARLGCGAHLSQLRRTHSGELTVADATPLAELLRFDAKSLLDILIPMRKFAFYQRGQAAP